MKLWRVTITLPKAKGARKAWHYEFAVLAADEVAAEGKAVAYCKPASLGWTARVEEDTDGVFGTRTYWT